MVGLESDAPHGQVSLGSMLMDELAEDPVWRSIAKVCMAVALIAVLFNMTTQWELEGHFQTWSFVRKSIAKVVSSGTVWAGVAVYAGWKLSLIHI